MKKLRVLLLVHDELLPPPAHGVADQRSSFIPSAAASRNGPLRSSMYETSPSISETSSPASSAARRMAVHASWNSVSGDPPRL